MACYTHGAFQEDHDFWRAFISICLSDYLEVGEPEQIAMQLMEIQLPSLNSLESHFVTLEDKFFHSVLNISFNFSRLCRVPKELALASFLGQRYDLNLFPLFNQKSVAFQIEIQLWLNQLKDLGERFVFEEGFQHFGEMYLQALMDLQNEYEQVQSLEAVAAQ